ncbi:trigger factor [Candidatus Falkowbacteria bacterium]|nr:trigger factor [Candidatus Falkowbacteria bacterium]
MKIDVQKLPRGQVELTIELTPEEYQPFLEQAAKKISENTKIPGFRPGKASFELIEKKLGKAEVWQQALEPAVQKTFVKALNEQNLITVGSPHVDVIKLAPDNPVIYKAVVSLLPKAELGDYSKIKISKKPVEIKNDQIQKALNDLRKMYSRQSLVERPAKAGDRVEIDFEIFLDKIPVENGQQQKFSLVIGEKTFIPGFEDNIIGLKKDDAKNFQLTFPKDYHQKNLAGKLVDFKVKLNAVYEIDLPKLDDNFAQTLGGFNSIKEVEGKVRENLKSEAENKQSQNLEEELLDKIIALSKFEEIPDLLINSEIQKMIEELEHSIAHQGLKFEDYLNHIKKTKEELMLDFTPQAVKRIKSALIMRQVGQKEDLKVAESEIDSELARAKVVYEEDKQAQENLKQPAYRDYVKNILAARKVIEHLKQKMIQ